MLFQPGQDICEVEDCAIIGADRMKEGLEGYGAEVEGKTFEGGAICFILGDSGACAGRVGVFGGPF